MSRKNRLLKRKRAEAREAERARAGPGYKDIVKENPAFAQYYKAQQIVPEGQWDIFMNTLRDNLPAAFRINGFRSQARSLLKIIEGQYFQNMLNVQIDGEGIDKPICLEWYPDKLAWQLKLSRVAIRKSEVFERLHNFLVSETESGNISRQETVSMIPPVLLDVKPHHKILDMCAAPGSKTAQVIEMLHREGGKTPDGVVVANDIDNKRCYMLVHQAKRMHSPCFIVTNNDATNFPNLKVKTENGMENVKFDRILCDVPCSGDGTIRKNIDVWTKWNVANGNNLYNLQVRIVRRGLELLANGGRLVYSTCSMNPVEDEAVMATVLQQCGGRVELVEVLHTLPGLKALRGINTWKVMNRKLEFYDSYDQVPTSFQTQIRPNMFPPPEDVVKDLHLERCLRILPHLQDTGGFFVAVLHKTSDILPWESVPDGDLSAKDSSTKSSKPTQPPKKKKKVYGYKEDPYIFFKPEDPTYQEINKFYKLQDSFLVSQLLSRCEAGRKRNIYFVSKFGKAIVECNQENAKIINTGVRMFSRCDNKDNRCSFRLVQEGLPNLYPYMTENRIMKISKPDLIHLLSSEYPEVEKYSESVIKQLSSSEDPDSGCCVLIYSPDEDEDDLDIILCGWKGKASLRCYVPKSERIHYLRIAGVDVSELEKREKKFKSKNEDGPANDEDEHADDKALANAEAENVGSTSDIDDG